MEKQNLSSTALRDTQSLIHPFTNLKSHLSDGPLVITHGKGISVFDENGTEYLESMSGLWCTSLGWSEPRLVEAATKAMQNLPFYHSFNGKVPAVTAELGERLLDLAPRAKDGPNLSKVFFANSGSEAVDTAIKLVWYVNNARGRVQKKKIIARDKAYHGTTIASASLTGLPAMHNAFDLPIDRVVRTGCPHHYRFAAFGESEQDFATRLAAELEQLIQAEGPDTVAAFICEPVMGAGGVLVPPETYFAKIQAVLKKYDVLLIADEVICGFGRTGNMWGSQTFDIKPDMITSAKALSSAYIPISALMVSDEIFQDMADESGRQGIFGHGHTYGGHPVACAVALETLNIYQQRDIVGSVQSLAPLFQDGLKALGNHPLVGEARGVGLVGALELVKDKTTKESFAKQINVGGEVIKRMLAHNMIGRNMGDAIAFAPPLIINEGQIRDMFSRTQDALDETHKNLLAQGHIEA
jgi:4-aminobutyrate--pyruvate transaminase